jgi:hypothetical protein
MALTLLSLDDDIRELMLDEIKADIAANVLYLGRYLSSRGQQEWPRLLQDAAQAHDDTWLADELRRGGRLNTTAERHNRSGSVSTVKVPVTAPEMLAEGEFNRFFLRALCLYAIANGIPQLVIYRAKTVANPRPDSESKLGNLVSAAALLADLRANIGIDTFLRLPPGPNSGLSGKLP